jgi:two-component system, NtrC family, sensor histidine kinase HydH
VSPQRARVLVVDDNVAFVDNLLEILEDAGYGVQVAHTCQSALERVARGIDVALVDLRLPDGEGTQLAQKLKQLQPDSEVIVLTGFATLESAAAAVRAGACAYLLKPCATPDLLLAVEQAMRQVRLHAEKRELARRTQVAEKLAAVGTMTAGLSHEIRNPLNAAGLQLTVLERRVRKLSAELQPPLLEPLTLVQDEIRRLEHILQDFLQFARPEQVTMNPVEVTMLMERVVQFFAADAGKRHISLFVEGEKDLVVAGDEGRLRQALVNLTLNALDATPAGGRITLAAQRHEDTVLVTVTDSGPGIPADVVDRIFEPFFTTKAAGSGLGLPIVHAIITQHGGTLTVANRRGGGAQFKLRLPRPRS